MNQRAQLVAKLQGVDGWLDLEEAWALHEAARLIADRSERPLAVEIGSWQGRSAIAIALGLAARGGGTLISVDPHQGRTPYHAAHYGHVDTFDAFIKNIAAAGVAHLVQPLRMTSSAARTKLSDHSVDMLFVDGSHEYEDVKADIISYESTLKDRAVVAFNDPSVPDVHRALREFVLRPQVGFRHPWLVENTLFFAYDRQAGWTYDDAAALRRARAVMQLRAWGARIRPLAPGWAVRGARRLYDALLQTGRR